ncbi:ABC transporter permease [Pelagibacterium limicola]|uniref:ABC transporter permease n=1 Tax=Pelagibacterium limicola TaxID=2791022 RepID=UPI0018AFFD34|nr:ABC transporter permease [Pelagibacterium limicola]
MMTILQTANSASFVRRRLDPLGVVVTAVAVAGLFLPFVIFKANRIVPGEGVPLWAALPVWAAIAALVGLGSVLVIAMLRVRGELKLAASGAGLLAVVLLIGLAADTMSPQDDSLARIGIGAGSWLLILALALMLTDALSRLDPGPWTRIGSLAFAMVVFGAILGSGTLNELSILKEYGSRAPAFWQETRRHLELAFGSVLLATGIGVPVGIACHRFSAMRSGVLNLLNIVQTIPSIALFGILIAPLAWIAANVPGARTIGISGIGMAPAMVALTAYALLPVVANTLVGLTGLATTTVEAARGMGMTSGQRLWHVELPLAMPVILTGIRIILVQNIGLSTIAALIGGGGLGVFVFQGAGQTAIDLVLLGAAPTVALAFAAAVLLGSFIDLSAERART